MVGTVNGSESAISKIELYEKELQPKSRVLFGHSYKCICSWPPCSSMVTLRIPTGFTALPMLAVWKVILVAYELFRAELVTVPSFFYLVKANKLNVRKFLVN